MITPRMTPEIQARLYKEADARFWAQTGYAPGRHLDPENPVDAHMIPVWQDIYKKVHAEWASGKLVTTYDHPVVTGLLQEAAHEMAKAADALGASIATPPSDPIGKAAHAADSDAAHAKANAAAQKAATYQPVTASPVLANQAAMSTMTMVAGIPPAGVVIGPAPAEGGSVPVAQPSIPAHDAIDMMQTAHAADNAAAVQVQVPAPDAPKPPPGPTKGVGIAVVGGVVATLALAMLLGSTDGRVSVRGAR